MLTNKKPEIEKLLDPFIRPLSNVNPNLLTLLGSIPPLLFFVFVINGNYILALIAFLGSAIDFLDGMVARKYNKVSAFGGFLDSTIDRVADFLIISSFAFGNIARWEIIAPLLLVSFLTSYIRSRAGLIMKDHMEFAVGLIERPERYLFIILALVLYVLFPYLMIANLNIAEIILALLTIFSSLTVIQRIIHAQKML